MQNEKIHKSEKDYHEMPAALDEIDDGHVELSSQCGMLESNARTWLSRAYDNIDEANEEVEREKYQKLSSTIMSDKEDFNEFLKRNRSNYL